MKTFSTATKSHAPTRRSAVDAVPAAVKAVSVNPHQARAATGPKTRRTGGELAAWPNSTAKKGTAVTPANLTWQRRLPTGLTWSEATIQRQVFNILKLRGVKGLIFWHVANGDPSARRRLWKAQLGETAGIPDVLLFYRNKLYCLELKKLGGKATEAQFEMLDRFREQGAEVTIAFGYFDAIAWLERMKLLIGRTI